MQNFLRKGGPWVLAQIALILAVLVLGPVLGGPPWSQVCTPVGSALIFAGAVFGISGACSLGRNLTPYPKPLESSRLVRTGIFRIVRHPLYTSLILLASGWSIVWSSGSALLAAAGLAVLLDAKARLEERWLRARFPDYAAYALRVRRLLPWIY
jgi:protein-S-isoprenylcysteine O-methyltransferase Ste14